MLARVKVVFWVLGSTLLLLEPDLTKLLKGLQICNSDKHSSPCLIKMDQKHCWTKKMAETEGERQLKMTGREITGKK